MILIILQIIGHLKRVTHSFDDKTVLIPQIFPQAEFEGVEHERQPNHYHFLWHRNHSYWVMKPEWVLNKAKCGLCNQWISKENYWKKHQFECRYCNVCSRSWILKGAQSRMLSDPQETIVREEEYRQYHKCAGPRNFMKKHVKFQPELMDVAEEIVCRDWKPSQIVQERSKKSNERIYFADIEAFIDKEREDTYTPYAIGIMERRDTVPKIFYGINCMKDFLDYCSKLKGILNSFHMLST